MVKGKMKLLRMGEPGKEKAAVLREDDKGWTPPEVELGKKPPQFLKDGDVMELSVDSPGKQCQVCKQA